MKNSHKVNCHLLRLTRSEVLGASENLNSFISDFISLGLLYQRPCCKERTKNSVAKTKNTKARKILTIILKTK